MAKRPAVSELAVSQQANQLSMDLRNAVLVRCLMLRQNGGGVMWNMRPKEGENLVQPRFDLDRDGTSRVYMAYVTLLHSLIVSGFTPEEIGGYHEQRTSSRTAPGSRWRRSKCVFAPRNPGAHGVHASPSQPSFEGPRLLTWALRLRSKRPLGISRFRCMLACGLLLLSFYTASFGGLSGLLGGM